MGYSDWGRLPLLLGLVSVLAGSVVLATVMGLLPAEGRMLAPAYIVAAVGGVFVVAGILIMVPEKASPSLRVALFLGVVALLAIICNWSAFAPGVSYGSSGALSFGPFSFLREGVGGSRLVFILAALILDLLILLGLASQIRDYFKDG
jgi:hypothetical protein